MSERRIVGLISIVNLNCRQVKVYLFSLLGELETELARFAMLQTSEEQLAATEFGAAANGRKAEIRDRYAADRGNGLDAPLVEYLYLSDLINIIAKNGWYSALGYESRSAFENHLGPLNDLRNKVAHLSRSLVVDADSCKDLWGKLDNVDALLFRLREA